jgi:hypothetical protein
MATALTGRFVADFASFNTAVEQAEVKLRKFAEGGKDVEKALTRVGDSFSGRRILSEADLAVKAVNALGGAAVLTASEHTRLNATLTEAIAKYAALGKTAPKSMVDLEAATRRVEPTAKSVTSTFSSMSSTLTAVAGAFGIAFSIGAVLNFGRQVLEAGDRIQKMADQTGLGIDQVQQLQYIAGQSGTSVESLVGAIQNLQQRLGDDSTGAAGAMRKLHINMETFLKLDSYTQLVTLADAIRGVRDPTDQASLAAALFGKTWKEILPAIKSGMKEVGDAAPIMSDAAVKGLDALGDAWKRAQQASISWAGETITALGKVTTYFTEPSGLVGMIDLLFEKKRDTGLSKSIEALKPPTQQAVQGLRDLTLTAGQAEVIEHSLNTRIRESTEVMKKASDETDRLGKIRERAFGLDTVRVMNDEIKAIGGIAGVAKMSAAETTKFALALDEATSAARRNGLADVAAKFEALREAIPAATVDMGAFALAMSAVEPAVASTFTEFDRLIPTLSGVEELIAKIPFAVSAVPPALTSVAVAAESAAQRTADAWESAETGIHNLAAAFAQLAQISGTASGGLVRDIGNILGALDLSSKAATQFSTGIASIKGGEKAAGFADLASGAVGMVGAFQAATDSSSTFKNTLGGAAVGAKLGAQFAGPWGAAVGAVIGAVGGLLKSVFGGGEASKTNKERDSWIMKYVGIDDLPAAQAALKTLAVDAGATDAQIRALFDSRTVKEFTAAEKVLVDLIGDHKKEMDDLAAVNKRAADEMKGLTDSFDGTTILADANRLVTVITNVGGATRLTKSEQQRLNSTLVEALEKYRVLGLEAPEAMVALELATRAADAATQGLTQSQQTLLDTANRAAAAMGRGTSSTGGIAYDPNNPEAALADFLSRNPGDISRFNRAVVSDTEHNSMDFLAGLKGYASGTGGQYVDFGRGTPVMLHGREKVTAQGDDGGWGALALEQARTNQLLKGMPKMIRDAILLAAA